MIRTRKDFMAKRGRVSVGIAAALIAVAAAAQASADSGSVIPLYPKGAVPSLGVPEIREMEGKTDHVLLRNVSEPLLELFRPAPGQANGTAVIVAPGGGFVGLQYSAEGTAVARRLAQHGVTAFVLKYRTILSPADSPMPEVHMKEMDVIVARAKSGSPAEVPRFAGEAHAVEDGVRALEIVRARAHEWGLDPKRVGVVGFSAGAFLAADLAIVGKGQPRPDFVGLIYGGVRYPVPADASPAFIAGAADDQFQPNDPLLLYTAWQRAGVPAELHLYERGGHGFGLDTKGTTSDHWLDELVWWLEARGLLDRQARK
jgi:acetyl esterase/lipase